jgi:hypothetical protein
LQSTSEVHGLTGVFATKNLKRERAEQKIRSDLTSIIRLSRERGG